MKHRPRTDAERSKLLQEVVERVKNATPTQRAAVEARRVRHKAAMNASALPKPSTIERAETLITLDEWGRRRYGSYAPHINTLRRWAGNGNIYPKPRKHGRAYMIHPDAVYVDPNNPQTLAEAMEEANGAPEWMRATPRQRQR